jgi:hypothetical protein
MFTNIAQSTPSVKSTSSTVSQSSSTNGDNICSENSPYDKIYTDEPVKIKPSKYCKIDKDAGKIYFCKPSGFGKSHICEYTAPYKKPSMFSFFSRGGKYRRSNKRKNTSKTRKSNKKNRTKKSKKSKK